MRLSNNMDIIFIEKLTVMALIGVFSWEQRRPQKLIFNIEMGWDNRQAGRSDKLEDCLNYSDVTESILSLVNSQRFSLVEKVAEETADKLIKEFKLPWVRIKVRKPGAIPQAASTGVIIERWQKN